MKSNWEGATRANGLWPKKRKLLAYQKTLREDQAMKAGLSFSLMMLIVLLLAPVGLYAQTPMGTAFTYQGRLTDGGGPANGDYDFEFKLYDDMSFQVGSTITVDDKQVANGLFAVELDFGGDIFTGDARLLEIGVRPGADTGAYTTLSPRQELTPSPYALALPGLWTQENTTSHNIIGGYRGNEVTASAVGATIGGGGEYDLKNRVTDDFGTVAGGRNNRAGDNDASVTNATDATVGGGKQNLASGQLTTIAGGGWNTANASRCFISGGESNLITDVFGVIGGGYNNQAGDNAGTAFDSGSATVGGGYDNIASGADATVPGGRSNTAAGAKSFAVGHNAKANHRGTFVWSDSAGSDFASTGADQFLVRAAGGVGIGKSNPAEQLDVSGTVQMTGFKMASGAASGRVLTSDGSGAGTWQAPAGDISGIGSVNCVPHFTANKTLGDSIITANSAGVGIGDNTPDYRLDIVGTSSVDAIVYLDAYWNPELFFDSGGAAADTKIHFMSGGFDKWTIIHDGSEDRLDFSKVGTGTILRLSSTGGGRVGINTTGTPAGTLDVNGSIYQRGGILHADYVFEPGYKLESIDKHAQFMWSERHLPAMPQARRDADGNEMIEIGSHRRGIVEELEKAHIYIEQLHKRIRALEATQKVPDQPSTQEEEIAALRQQNAELSTRLGKMETLVAELVKNHERGVR